MRLGKRKWAAFFLWGGAVLIVVGIALSYARLVPLVETAFYSEEIPTAPPLLLSTPSTAEALLPFAADEVTATLAAPPAETPVSVVPTETSTLTPTDAPEATPTMAEGVPTDALAFTPTPAPTETPTPSPMPATATPTLQPTPVVQPTLAPVGVLPQSVKIPNISLEAPVVSIGWKLEKIDGQNQAIWDVPNWRAAGWHNTSSRMGVPGNTVFNGHNTSNGEVFRDLYKVEVGSQILVEGDDGETYVYKVGEKYILREAGQPLSVRLENARYIQQTPDERLTLVTCHPYGSLANRLILIAYPDLESQAPERME